MLLEGKLTTTIFPSRCNAFDDNAAVLDEKLPYKGLIDISFTHRTMF